MILYSIFLATSVSAQAPKTNLFRKEAPPEAIAVQVKKIPQSRKSNSSDPAKAPGNLPTYYAVRGGPLRIAQGSPVILPAKQVGQVHRDLKPGDMIEAEIPESVIAFSDNKVPVRAIVRSGRLKGAIFLGEATLEQNSKRISVEFTKVRDPRQKEGFGLKGTGYDVAGSLGIKGKHYSGESKYFGAEFLAAFAAGYSDALVEKDVTPFGQIHKQETVANAGREGMANAMSRTADRFADRIKNAPEFTAAQGPIVIQILITE